MITNKLHLTTKEKIAFIGNMHTMLAAGIPILESVDSLLEDAKGNMRKMLLVLRADLEQGQHMASALAKFPNVFDRVTTNIIKASEEAGTLDATLNDIKANIKKDIEFNDKIRSAFIYPVFILVVFVAVLAMILIVVVPKISTVFSRMNVPLPLPTKIMIFMSEALLKNTIPVILGITFTTLTIIFLYKKNRRRFISALISMPGISKMAQKIDVTRFTRSLHLLLNAGIPITTALELTEQVVVKKEVQNAILHAKNTVLSGKSLSSGLKDSKKVFPPIMLKIVEAGEKTGTLDKSLQDVSEYLDYEVSGSLKTLTSLIEPLLLVFVGGMVGGMMMAIISPIYSLVGQIGGQ